MAMHFTSHSPHVTHHVTTSVTDVTLLCLCDSDMTPFPCFTFIVVI